MCLSYGDQFDILGLYAGFGVSVFFKAYNVAFGGKIYPMKPRVGLYYICCIAVTGIYIT
jgi:hypothetical protein